MPSARAKPYSVRCGVQESRTPRSKTDQYQLRSGQVGWAGCQVFSRRTTTSLRSGVVQANAHKHDHLARNLDAADTGDIGHIGKIAFVAVITPGQ
jgi:hypothetical protein